ncbi:MULTISPECIES: selenocysteine-specific translation elongation factor [Clostridium]|uniref:Selenocysteine-specific elongation factor n=2 Tax=Clostridium TaxID=1485 RepID=A0A151APA8_9CLOT|nr:MULTISPECIES: selenocysteine-specific translation elongation factor [Clostridium]KYH29466.1 selenocysteine-specific elongation factor [Clostridium colicanis DSM 13634]MBE6042783.1 selenocysteine-specific translation elongation factor [Clostridium thermopalmarium]PRR70767.1 Selenocysteine-specific elongation factor [Clostridium thermopalmarium DSM 5974]PVZ22551.1 selenocysteine-specific translation elongation factor SelB [Clostridium thermopalmarium DSM 5974]
MKNVVMGTAGHIDHGKTALVKRLTGIDTDRLKEEKRRGMTIELGFAPLTLPEGKVISVIDVPGHEKFIKTMVAGVTGIDFVMLVIAADEGIMPQTKEHIDIISLLNIKSGVVALTKTDLVDEEWLNMVREDIRENLKDTPLKDYSIIPVSSVSGEGIQDLIKELEVLAKEASKKEAQNLFRMAIDRVFTITGHGTVITGTIAGGEVKKGDIIEILPKGLEARVRGIQVHNKNVDMAASGDRCALNIVGIEKSEIERGNVAAEIGLMKATRLVDAVLYGVKDVKNIVHNQRVHVHIGTKEVLARIRILGKDEILGGDKGYVQLRFEEPVAALRGDKFIIRSYSPEVTIGGGTIIFHSTRNRQRFSEESIKELNIGEKGALEELIELCIKDSKMFLSLDELFRLTLGNKEEIEKVLNNLVYYNKIVYLKDVDKYLSRELYYKYMDNINSKFKNLYKKYPFRFQIDKEEIKSKLFNYLDVKEFTALINSYIKDGIFEVNNNFLIQGDKEAIKKILQMPETELIEKVILEDGLGVRNIQRLKETVNIGEYKHEDIVKFLVQIGKVVDLGGGVLLHKDIFNEVVKKIKNIFDKKKTLSVAEIRDYLETSRKIALALMEYLDRLGVTIREGDIRRPGINYMKYFT